MRYYVVKGKYDAIYEGEITKATDGGVEFQSNVKNYYVYDFDRKVWEKWPLDNIHKNIYLSKKMYKGLVLEYPSFGTAKLNCEKELR